MRVLLINPKMSGGKPWIPLGMAYIAAFLRQHGIEVKIIDNNLQDLDRDSLSNLVGEFKPDIIGTGGMTVQCKDAGKIGMLIKSIDENIKLVYGGVHFTFQPEDGLKYGDICVIGEGEETFLEICNGEDLSKIKGIAFRKNGETVFTEIRPLLDITDNFPLPAYDLIELDRYEDRLITGEKAISMLTGRGCPYNCVFCASPQFWKRKARFHSLDDVMAHIEYLIENYDLKYLRIMDDTFTLNKKRVVEFCDRIEEKNIRLGMTALTNVKNADYEMFSRMKEAGFTTIAFGVESGNEEILKLIKKGCTKEDIRSGVSTAKKAGLDTELLFMIGNIGETKDTVKDSINFAAELNPCGSNSNKKAVYNWFQFATPFPGSAFYEIKNDYGRVTSEDWDEYHHQKPIFVPADLTAGTMIKLREHALKKTNPRSFSWSWVPEIIRGNEFVRSVYRRLIKFSG